MWRFFSKLSIRKETDKNITAGQIGSLVVFARRKQSKGGLDLKHIATNDKTAPQQKIEISVHGKTTDQNETFTAEEKPQTSCRSLVLRPVDGPEWRAVRSLEIARSIFLLFD
jgi:hypothetical protein